MPNLPYQTSRWNTHAKVDRQIRFPLSTSITVLEVEFTYEGPLDTYVPIPFASVEPAYSADGVTLYLCAQGDLTNIGGGAIRYTRTWCSLPPQQTTYGARLIDRPVMHDITAGGSYAVSFDNGVTSHVFTARKSVTVVGAITPYGSTEVVAANALPSVTITVGETGGGTTTFSTADSASTIQSALAAGIGSSIYVTKGEVNITAVGPSLATQVKYVSASADAGLDISYDTDGTNGSITIRATNQTRALDADTPTNIRTLTSAAHGGAAGDLLAVWNGDKLLGTLKVLSVTTDTVTIRADEAPWTIGTLAVTHLQFADTSSTRYVNGPANCTVKEVSDFYLPGVSSGITTPADIALVAPKLDPVSWLTAIQAATAYVVIEGSQLTRWLGGPIYQQTTISVQMSDALDTVAVGA